MDKSAENQIDSQRPPIDPDISMTKHLFFVLGTAAELIKVFPLIAKAQKAGWPWTVVSTGQSDFNFWSQYKDFGLDPVQSLKTLTDATDLKHASSAAGWFLKALLFSPKNKFPMQTKNPVILVHGDTLSTLIGAVWAKRLGWPLAHVEAGLRSGSLLSPFPEEICRRLVTRLTDIHFAPSAATARNILRTIPKAQVVDTGHNTLVDAVLEPSAEGSKIPATSSPYAVFNIHRFENLNQSLRWKMVMDLTAHVAQQMPVMFIQHPQTQAKLTDQERELLRGRGVQFFDRLPFSQFIQLLKNSEFLVSDGGSNQEECYYLNKPLLVLRRETERTEGLGENAVLCNFDMKQALEFSRNYNRHKSSFDKSTFRSPSDAILLELSQSK